MFEDKVVVEELARLREKITRTEIPLEDHSPRVTPMREYVTHIAAGA
jgi:hypothetical protein